LEDIEEAEETERDQEDKEEEEDEDDQEEEEEVEAEREWIETKGEEEGDRVSMNMSTKNKESGGRHTGHHEIEQVEEEEEEEIECREMIIIRESGWAHMVEEEMFIGDREKEIMRE